MIISYAYIFIYTQNRYIYTNIPGIDAFNIFRTHSMDYGVQTKSMNASLTQEIISVRPRLFWPFIMFLSFSNTFNKFKQKRKCLQCHSHVLFFPSFLLVPLTLHFTKCFTPSLIFSQKHQLTQYQG